MMKLLYVLLSIFAVFTIIVNGARLGMIALFIQIGLWLFSHVKHKAFTFGRWLMILMFSIIAYSAFQLQPASLGRFEALQEGIHGGSVDIRTNLTINGLRLVKETVGIGVGAGGFEQSVMTGSNMLDTAYIGSAHNLWIEVMANYGLLVWSLFILWLATALVTAIKILQWSKKVKHYNITNLGKYNIILMSGFPAGFMLNSSILRWTMLWTALATVAAMNEIGLIHKKCNLQ
jgi:hypothetical protein